MNSLKRETMENNPCNDDYHVWVRELSDIKTFEETFQDRPLYR